MGPISGVETMLLFALSRTNDAEEGSLLSVIVLAVELQMKANDGEFFRLAD